MLEGLVSAGLYQKKNTQVPIQNSYLKLLNICKFTHDRKTN